MNSLQKSSIEKMLYDNYSESVFHTHVSMIQPKGKFTFNRKDLETFFNTYCETIDNLKVGVAEKPQDYLPILVDVDIKLEDTGENYGEHIYDETHVSQVIDTYQSVLRNIVNGCDDKDLTCVLLEKPIYKTTKGNKTYVKNGFHLHFPYIFLNKIDQEVHLIPRVQSTLNDMETFKDLGIEKSGNVIDKSCCKVPWLMYGSRKSEDMKPYLVSKIFDSDSNEISLEDAFSDYCIYNDDEEIIPIKENVQFYLPRILSIRAYNRDVKDLKNGLVSPLKEKIMKKSIKKKNKNSVPVKEALIIASKLIPMLSDFRADEYMEWMTIGWALYNIGAGAPEALELWCEFSSKSEKYCEDECIEQWEKMHKKDFTLGTLRYYASVDSPNKYKAFKQEQAEQKCKDQFLGNTNKDMATVFYELYGSDNVKIIDQSKGRYYKWNNQKRIWEQFKSHKMLVSSISNHLQPVYRKKMVDIFKKSSLCNDENERKSLDDKAKIVQGIIKNLGTTGFLKNTAEYYLSAYYDSEFENRLDTSISCLPVKNGIIDLKTLEIRERTQTDLFTFELNVEYNTEDVSKAQQFMTEICCNDVELSDYLIRLMGYSMTLEVADRSMHILWGKGCNGKSTLMDIMRTILGKFYSGISEKVLVKGGKRDLSSELEVLKTARLAVLSEIEEGDKLNEKRVKEITSGNDVIHCNPKNRDPFEFKPQCKLTLLCNDKPVFDIDDQAMIDRIKFIPFLARFEKSTQNTRYCDELRDVYLDQFFTLFCEGAYRWYQGEELKPCSSMQDAMKEYVNELDIIEQWIEENCEKGAGYRISGKDAWADFIGWCVLTSNTNKHTKQSFGKGLTNRYTKVKSKGIMTYKGFQVRSEEVQRLRPDNDSGTDSDNGLPL